MRIQHNIMAMNAYRNYNTNTSALSKNLEKLSSGYKINRAGDDAAGLAISEKMCAQITGLNAAQKNVKDGISLVKTAEGAMQEIQDMLNRMDYLATQSANGTYDDPVDRMNLQKEVDALKTEINRIADSANFNGINLLDGSMDADKVTTTTADSAISNITTEDYAPKGASDAFSASYITNRPEAATKQTNAVFDVTFDDINLSQIEAGDIVKVTVGDATLQWKVTGTGDTTLDDIVDKLAATGGGKMGGTENTDWAKQANNAVATDKADTASWDAKYTAGDGTAANGGKYIKIDGHYYEMAKTGSAAAGTLKITFTQMDTIGDGENVNPDFHIEMTAEDAATGSTKDIKKTGTQNWQVQNPTGGVAIGSSHQAQVSVDIDFSKLKDGDTFTAGDKTYTFKIGEGSTTTAAANLIDLSKIFAEKSDQSDAKKQADALTAIVNAMGTAGGSTTWSAGSGGVTDGIGRVTFQSLSTYKGDATGATTGQAYIGGNQNNGLCDMRTEAEVMKQFFGESKETGASTSFELDVTKIKAGDTFTIDGKTFEFTDGPEASSSKNIAIDLSSFGVSNGLLSSQSGDIIKEIKTAIEGGTNAAGDTVAPAFALADKSSKYTVTVDGNKLTLSAKDDNSTPAFENRVSAKVELPTVTTNGKALTLQIGDTADDFNQMTLSIGDMHVDAMGTKDGAKISDIDISTQAGAKAAVQTIKDAINYVSSVRGDLGATQNRLEHTANNLSVMAENIQDAESTIRDTDIAEEMMSYTKNNILIQSAQAMLAQANAVPQGVLQLLG